MVDVTELHRAPAIPDGVTGLEAHRTEVVGTSLVAYDGQTAPNTSKWQYREQEVEDSIATRNRIVNGPTAFPQPAFKVRVSGERMLLAGPATSSGP